MVRHTYVAAITHSERMFMMMKRSSQQSHWRSVLQSHCESHSPSWDLSSCSNLIIRFIMEVNFTCVACCADYKGIRTDIEDSALCALCVRQMFETGMGSNTDWPPHWGAKKLDPWDFLGVLDTQLCNRFDQMAREHNIPVRQRIYCRQIDPPRRLQECGTFLGRSVDEMECRRCDKCNWCVR